jgi:hypothetical protein
MADQAIVWVTALKSGKGGGVAGALREVLKYATKGEKDQRTQSLHAAAVELAFRNVHRVSVAGALRAIKVREQDGASEDVRAEDLHDQRALSCENCGVTGEWRWGGIVSSRVVEELGGFGPLRLASSLPAGIG